MKIEAHCRDRKEVREIMSGLPEYFTPEALENAQRDLEREFLGIYEEGRLLGFIIYVICDAECEILWMAVEKDHRGRGLGADLLDHLEGSLRDRGINILKVKTLDDSAGYDPYLITTGFYKSRGFVKVAFIEVIRDWGPDNPCAIFEKNIPSKSSLY